MFNHPTNSYNIINIFNELERGKLINRGTNKLLDLDLTRVFSDFFLLILKVIFI